MKRLIALFFCLTVFVLVSNAQTYQQSAPEGNSFDCQKTLEQAESDFSARKSIRKEIFIYRAERNYNLVLEKCPDLTRNERANIEENIKVAQEEMAERDLNITRYFFRLNKENKIISLRGGCSRLQNIIATKPHYSKLKEVNALYKENGCVDLFSN